MSPYKDAPAHKTHVEFTGGGNEKSTHARRYVRLGSGPVCLDSEFRQGSRALALNRGFSNLAGGAEILSAAASSRALQSM